MTKNKGDYEMAEIKYKLKKGEPNIRCVDGSFAGTSFNRGELYQNIPDEEKNRFEVVGKVEPSTDKKKTKNTFTEEDKL